VDDAIQNLAKSVDLDPRWAPPHAALSGAYSRRGEHEPALEEARKAQQLEATWPWAVAVGALSLGYAGKPDEAVSEFRRALEMAPRDAELLSLLALQYHHEHNDSEARRYAEEALAADDDAVPAHVLLAELSLEAGDAPTALMHASRAVAVSPTSVSGRLARADALLLSGMGPLALDEYRKALEHASRNINHGAPAGRIDAVRAALDKQTMPSLATTPATADAPKVTPRSRPPSRSQPTAPARSQPASRRPGDRSHPSGSLDDF
jgi:Tfp pilus assembly protein PilF